MTSRSSSRSSLGSSATSANESSDSSDTDATTPSKQQPCICTPTLDLIYQLATTSLPCHPLTQKKFHTKFQLQQLSDNQLSKLILPPTVVIQNSDREDDNSADSPNITLYRSDPSTGALQREQLSSDSSESIIDLFTTIPTRSISALDSCRVLHSRWSCCSMH